LQPPAVSPSSAGDLAIEQYDTNSDGIISGGELDKAVGLKASLARLDTNSDQGISADEIAEAITRWQATRSASMSINFLVTLDGQPLTGANVTYEPEAFMGDQLKPAICTTDDFGTGCPSIPKEQRPDPRLSGVPMGFYRVKISKNANGREILPAKYNTATEIGQEVSADVNEIVGNRLRYNLKSN
jgi:hypothetical protein